MSTRTLTSTPSTRRLLRERPADGGLLSETLQVQLVASLITGDWPVIASALKTARVLRLTLNSKVCTPFGGATLFPLQAALCAPIEASTAMLVVERLLGLGADPNIHWRDCSGNFTPLGKALTLRNFKLAELLHAHGADCTAALLHSDLLEGSRFDPALVKWLLDRGAAVAPATPGASSDGPPVVALLLRKLGRELHVSRQLSELHVAAGPGQQQWLLRRAADCLTLLLAAGAAPVGRRDPSGATAAAVAALQPADWAAVARAASVPPRWSPTTHHLFPRALHLEARQALLVARRGFSLPADFPYTRAGGGGGSPQPRQRAKQGAPPRPPTPDAAGRPPPRVYLDGNIVQNIICMLAPCSKP